MKKWPFSAATLAAIFSITGCNEASPIQSVDNENLSSIINSSKKCEQTDRGMECSYVAGDYFKVSIADIGTESAGIHFEKSNSEMPVYASFGILHGCVIVNRFKGAKGIPEWVFISPKDGNVYKTWQECGKAL
jgi:hypothetical protein